MAKIVVNYNGKETEREEICDGVVKYGDAYLLRCCETGEWKYCNQDRFDKLVAKFTSVETLGQEHISREGKKIRKERFEQSAPPAADPVEPATEEGENASTAEP